jgi:hypothetical protein
VSTITFIAKAELEVPIPNTVHAFTLGYGESKRIRFSIAYAADRPDEADRFLKEAIAQVAAELLAVSEQAATTGEDAEEGA